MQKKYKWVVSDCAPLNFPSEIYRGSFHYGKKSGESVPNGKTVDHGWGNTNTHYGNDTPKEVPHRLDIVWLSFRENKFYGGSFDLPKAKIEQLFEKGFTDLDNKPNGTNRYTYDEILVGVAPGGYVSVWLNGLGHNIQVAGFYGEETDVSFNDFNPDGIKDRKRYVNIVVDQIKSKELEKPIPFGLWEKHAQEYQLKPIVEGTIKSQVYRFVISSFNGNKEFFVHKEADNILPKNRTIPKKIEIGWLATNGNKNMTEIIFNEIEIMEAFKHLTIDEEDPEIQIIISLVTEFEVSISLISGSKKVVLKKYNFEVYED